MKTFKKFALDEATFQTTIATLNQDIPTGNYSDPQVVRALNSFVGSSKSYGGWNNDPRDGC